MSKKEDYYVEYIRLRNKYLKSKNKDHKEPSNLVLGEYKLAPWSDDFYGFPFQRILDENSDYIVMENFTLETLDAIADNSFIQSETDDFLDFTEKDPFSEGNY